MFARLERWVSWGAWGIALGLALAALFLTIRSLGGGDRTSALPTPIAQDFGESSSISLPAFALQGGSNSISRNAKLDTVIPNRSTDEVIKYTVVQGDSVFGIADAFGIQPETVLWANEAELNDDPHSLTPGQELNIPPIDGVYYQWEAGDTLESVAQEFEADVQDIIDWVGNQLDLTNPSVDPGQWIMVPGGHREFKQWIVPTIPRGSAGVSASLYGPGACPGGYEGGAVGSGAFIWPSPIHEISGNDYWSGHLGLDIAAGEGVGIVASDSGVVVFAGWGNGGYGNMVMIDHGNGYQTLYAHLSQVSVNCGQSVGQGQLIGYGGSTGNSTGPHLHFEIRYLDGFVNPWFVLPAP